MGQWRAQGLETPLYESRTWWEKALEMLLGPEWVAWQTLRSATPAERAQLEKLARQWRAIVSQAQESQLDDEVAVFLRRLDERTAFVAMFYPTAVWPWNRLMGIATVLVALAVLAQVVLNLVVR